ncbi:MAG TPA: Spy/CpxP family protein refolding chaperone [Rhodocyclaceae bacterium]|jgi:hypothetical protein
MINTPSINNNGYINRLQLGVIKATALLVGLGIGLSAQAAPDESTSRSAPSVEKSAPQHYHGNTRGHGMDTECGPQDRLEKLHKQLSLDSKQEVLWNNAKTHTDQLRDEFMKDRDQRRENMKKPLEGKAPDLRAIAADQDKQQEVRQQKLKAAREEWLKLYDVLNSEQKQQASEFLLGQIGMFPPPGPRGGDRAPGSPAR